MKITLINPSEKGILLSSGDRPPLGNLYIASYLRDKGHTVQVIDGNHEDNLIWQLKKFNPDFIGISFTTPMYTKAVEMARVLRGLLPSVKLVAGGAHPSADPDSCTDHFDFVVKGEGETGFELLIEMYKSLKYETFKSGNDNSWTVEMTGGNFIGKVITNLDWLPLPARDMVDMTKYNLNQDGKRTATLISSRGCDGHCVYCSRKALGQGFRAHSPEYVYKEVKQLKDKYGYDSFYFCDDMFTKDRQRVFDICKLLKPLAITFRVTTRADCVDRDMLKEMKDTGLDILSIGIEHADNAILKKAGKGMTIEQNAQVIDWCTELGIKVKAFFIINLPGATKATALKTIEWAKTHDLYSADFYPLTAYPGSSLWDYPEKLGMRLLDKSYGFIQAGEGLKVNIDSPEFPKEQVEEVLRLCQK